MMTMLRFLFEGAGDLLAPRLCPACGQALEPGGSLSIPLCPGCRPLLLPLAEPRCSSCGRPLVSEKGVCMTCRREKRSFDAAYPLFAYRGMAAILIGAYKFQGRRSLASFFAAAFGQVLDQRWPNHVLVPVPPRRASLRQRGWDPLEYILRILERRGFTVARLLERSGSVEQKRLSLEDRRRNAMKSYHLRRSSAVPRALVLVDDVFTTGATAEACASVLRENGADFIAVLTLAMEL